MAYHVLIYVNGVPEPFLVDTHKDEKPALEQAKNICKGGLIVKEIPDSGPPVKVVVPFHQIIRAEVHDDRPGLITPNKGLVDQKGNKI